MGNVVQVIFGGSIELSVAEHRQTAAILGWDDHLKAVVLQDCDRGFAHKRLVVHGGAAVEIDDFPLGFEASTRSSFDPAPECTRRTPFGQRCVACNPQDLLGNDTAERVVQHTIGQSRHGTAQLAQQLVAAEQPVAQRNALLRSDLGPGPGVQLSDLYTGRTDFVADAATRAVIHRMVG